MIYFDYSATTPVHPEVIRTIQEVLTRYYGNPSSLHGLGVQAELLLTRARQQIADLLQVPKETIIFTSGGTESNNLAIKGTALRWQQRGKHIITTAIEHASVYEPAMQLRQMGFDVTVLPVDQNGQVHPEQVEKAIREDTILVSIMHVNNEIGTIQPIAKIGEMLKRYPKVLFHADAVQALGKIPVRPEELGLDLMSLAAHKFRGPKGIGILYKRESLDIDPLIAGGGQEGGLRSGTENVAYIVGMAKAMRLAIDEQEQTLAHVRKLKNRLLERLRGLQGVVVNSPVDERLAVPHIVNVSCPGLKSEVIVHALEQRGFYISSRSACSSAEEKPSRVLLAIGASEAQASSGLRISIAKEHTAEDIDRLAEALDEVTKELRSIN
ncbi:aminotransferase V [Insulibacter thermoxylanivorax]|uniref:Aminotransferase V n=1 Tax=Insulibacter thermoxylanivorax TaxID=2749268 RepID=A0A916VF37_9BACL|nr:cysteine desulfurase family protein [Insulibacter thermoxylanivorax]GFR37433.1 aminotransferase V [Insulibacter thermoxylanivorax]